MSLDGSVGVGKDALSRIDRDTLEPGLNLGSGLDTDFDVFSQRQKRSSDWQGLRYSDMGVDLAEFGVGFDAPADDTLPDGILTLSRACTPRGAGTTGKSIPAITEE